MYQQKRVYFKLNLRKHAQNTKKHKTQQCRIFEKQKLRKCTHIHICYMYNKVKKQFSFMYVQMKDKSKTPKACQRANTKPTCWLLSAN